MKIVAISDTHGQYEQLEIPDGDVLVHAGDICSCSGAPDKLARFDRWIGGLPHRHKIVIAGNHDWAFAKDPAGARATVTNYTYLQDQAVEIDGIRFYGSPWTPPFFHWAFMAPPKEIRARWAAIPSNTDVLITHGPPRGVGDAVPGAGPQGCDDLLASVVQLSPDVHIFGHIHEAYGLHRPPGGGRWCINASVVDEQYRLVNAPVVIEI